MLDWPLRLETAERGNVENQTNYGQKNHQKADYILDNYL